MNRHNFYWDHEKKLEFNLQQVAYAFLEVLNDISTSLDTLAEGPSNLTGSVEALTKVVGDYAVASGVNVHLSDLKNSVDDLTKVANEAVERSMRNETLDTMREQNTKLQCALGVLREENEQLRQALDAKKE